MSTKIWEAYRIPAKRLNEFCLLVRRKTLKAFLADMERIAPRIWVTMTPDEKKGSLYKYLTDMLRKASATVERSGLDYDARLSIFLDGRYAYIIPYGCAMPKPNELPNTGWIEDYHYQNQADPPDPLPGNWRQRARTWDKVLFKDDGARRLSYIILDWAHKNDNGYDILGDLMTLCDNIEKEDAA